MVLVVRAMELVRGQRRASVSRRTRSNTAPAPHAAWPTHWQRVGNSPARCPTIPTSQSGYSIDHFLMFSFTTDSGAIPVLLWDIKAMTSEKMRIAQHFPISLLLAFILIKDKTFADKVSILFYAQKELIQEKLNSWEWLGSVGSRMVGWEVSS